MEMGFSSISSHNTEKSWRPRLLASVNTFTKIGLIFYRRCAWEKGLKWCLLAGIAIHHWKINFLWHFCLPRVEMTSFGVWKETVAWIRKSKGAASPRQLGFMKCHLRGGIISVQYAQTFGFTFSCHLGSNIISYFFVIRLHPWSSEISLLMTSWRLNVILSVCAAATKQMTSEITTVD